MTIKEVEKKLNIPRASVRFYEKEGLISPARMENDYRDYSHEDVDTLRKIIIFRKLGLSIEQIKSLFAGTLSLSEAIEINIKDLESQIDEINGALEVCREIVVDSRATDFDDFDSEKYWNEIFEKERSGRKFFDIAKDSLDYQKGFFLQYFGGDDGSSRFEAITSLDNKFIGGSPWVALIGFISWCVFANLGFRNVVNPWMGMFIAAIAYVLASIGMWITYEYAQKHPEKGNTIILVRRCMIVLPLIILLGISIITIGDNNANREHDKLYGLFLSILLIVYLLLQGTRVLLKKCEPSWGIIIFTGIMMFFLALLTPFGSPVSEIILSWKTTITAFTPFSEYGVVGWILLMSYLYYLVVDAVRLWKKL